MIDRIIIKKKRKKEAAYAILYFTKLIYIGKTEKNPNWKIVRKYVKKMQHHLMKLNQQKRLTLIYL